MKLIMRLKLLSHSKVKHILNGKLSAIEVVIIVDSAFRRHDVSCPGTNTVEERER